MSMFNSYNVRAVGADGAPLYFQNISIYDNDSLDAYAARLSAAGLKVVSTDLVDRGAAVTAAPVFQDIIRTLPNGIPEAPHPALNIDIGVELLVYGAIAAAVYYFFLK